MNLLLAEDDAVARMTLSAVLKGLGYEKWESIERYVEERSEAQFSHGYCPECYEKHVRPQIEKR
jgi:CheY-like chemotaxis protein